MIERNKIKSKKKLHDREFLFGIFARQGFVKDADAFLHKNSPGMASKYRGDYTQINSRTHDTQSDDHFL